MTDSKKTIISASRRTDLPAFHYDWLQRVLAAGRVEIANPRFPEKKYSVDLRPESVHSMVLWSKNFSGVAHDPMLLADYNLYFQYTINNYSPLLEPNVPGYRQTLATLERLLARYSPEQFNIRFDPVIISNLGELCPTLEKPGKARLDAFEGLCRDMSLLGMTGARLSTSYLALYGHVRKRLIQRGLDIIHLNDDLQRRFFAKMADIAAKYGMALYCCASPSLASASGLQEGRCIDAGLLQKLFGGKLSQARDGGQRQDCRCHKSVDIGDYNKACLGGCLYCYRRT